MDRREIKASIRHRIRKLDAGGKQSRAWIGDKGSLDDAKKTVVQTQDGAKKLMAALRALEKKSKAGPNSAGDIAALSKVENTLFRVYKEVVSAVAHVKEITKYLNTGKLDSLA